MKRSERKSGKFRMRAIGVVALGLLAGRGPAAHAAAADEAISATAPIAAARPPIEAPNKVALVLGLGSPWGELGLSYQRQLRPSFAIETGLGLGATGLQLAALPKWSLGSGGARLYFEAGPSLTLDDRTGAGLWAAAEAGFESSFGAWTLGFGAGASILAAGAVKTPICFDECSTRGPGTWLPEIRLVVGRSF